LFWEQILNLALALTPGLIGGFVGSFLVLAAGHFVATDFLEQPFKWSWGKKVLFVSAGTLLGAFSSLLVALGDADPVDWGKLQADWSKLLYYTVAGAGWFHIVLGFMNAAQAFAKAKTTGKKAVKAATQALLETDEKDKAGEPGK